LCCNQRIRSSWKTAPTNHLRQAIKDIPDTAARAKYDDHFIQASVKSLVSPWMQYFIKYDPAPTMEKVKCPVLAFGGEKDLQVPVKVNLAAVKAALDRGGNKRIVIKEFPRLNHLFQECSTGLPAEYATIEQTFSPVALHEILTWIKMQTQ
jgi:fermentation-respiration switch protein FrsA (DUF1100 family)